MIVVIMVLQDLQVVKVVEANTGRWVVRDLEDPKVVEVLRAHLMDLLEPGG